MKKAFTLVELLVVVVVIVTLMGITFRISSVGSSSNAKNYTASRMQRLENCLSGYYAAYGSYPPVRLHGSRDYTYAVNRQGIQQVGKNGSGGTHESELSWDRVEAACRSQPLAFEFPFKGDNIATYVKTISRELQKRYNSNDKKYKAYKNNPALGGGFEALQRASLVSSKKDDAEWTETQVFKFGVLSYLLPRYLIAFYPETSTDTVNLDENLFDDFEQWEANNALPGRFESGTPYTSWRQVMKSDKYLIALLPSQAVCARWLPNLEGTLQNKLSMNLTLYGVQLIDTDEDAGVSTGTASPQLYSAAESQSGGSGGTSQQYVLDGIDCVDGWGNGFYYYSMPPYQSYRLWSAGPNEKTFPPWVTNEELKKLRTQDQETAQTWKADDIVQMSN